MEATRAKICLRSPHLDAKTLLVCNSHTVLRTLRLGSGGSGRRWCAPQAPLWCTQGEHEGEDEGKGEERGRQIEQRRGRDAEGEAEVVRVGERRGGGSRLSE